MREELFAGYLKKNCAGRRKIMSGRALEKALHMSGNELRKQVNKLRRKGVPIASNQDGYFYAVSAGEVYATIKQLQKIVVKINALEGDMQKLTDDFIKEVEKIAEKKEKELMEL